MSTSRSHRLKLIAAFAAIYVIWGSTYLAIRFGIESFPPFLMAGGRFVVAGGLLMAWERLRGTPAPTRSEWRNAAIVGGLLLVGGNGIVTWAELRVPSGLAAVLIAAVPLWVAVLDRVFCGGPHLTKRTVVGIAMGLAGVFLLVRPDSTGARAVDPVGGAALVLAALFWAIGSLRSRSVSLPKSPSMSTATQMLAGGGLGVIVGTLAGEWTDVDAGAITGKSALAFVYLITLGSIVALRAYTWLLRTTSATAVATYAFVNPVVAVLLGWALGGERLGADGALASALIVSAVLALQLTRARASGTRPARPRSDTSKKPESIATLPRVDSGFRGVVETGSTSPRS